MIRTILSRLGRKYLNRSFCPYLLSYSIGSIDFRFFIGTKLAQKWYDPISSSTIIEHNWLLKNVDFSDQVIIDGGAHHGLYSVLMGLAGNGSTIVSVDPVEANLTLTDVNMSINNLSTNLVRSAISNEDGITNFDNTSNGRIVKFGGIEIPVKRLPTIMANATIVKLDIEGSEFVVLPDQIDAMADVHTWIVEIHTREGEPKDLVRLFMERNFRLDWLNNNKGVIEKYEEGAEFDCHHTTIFARK